MEQFTEGFALQASLILALGAQNIFVLESGLQRRRHLLAASVCTLCDALLIAIGVCGAATLFAQVPFLKIGFGIAGIAFLAYYGFLKLTTRTNFASADVSKSLHPAQISVVVAQALAFSLLNPHVYLDTIVLIGGYSAQYSSLSERSIFGCGATAFSTIWFFGLALFSARLSAYLSNPRMMRIISLISGMILLSLALKLGFDVWSWIERSPGLN